MNRDDQHRSPLGQRLARATNRKDSRAFHVNLDEVRSTTGADYVNGGQPYSFGLAATHAAAEHERMQTDMGSDVYDGESRLETLDQRSRQGVFVSLRSYTKKPWL